MAKSIQRRILARLIIFWTNRKVDADYHLDKCLKKFKKLVKEK